MREFYGRIDSRTVIGNTQAALTNAERRRPVYVVFGANDGNRLAANGREVYLRQPVGISKAYEHQFADFIRGIFYIYFPRSAVPNKACFFNGVRCQKRFAYEGTADGNLVTCFQTIEEEEQTCIRTLHFKQGCNLVVNLEVVFACCLEEVIPSENGQSFAVYSFQIELVICAASAAPRLTIYVEGKRAKVVRLRLCALFRPSGAVPYEGAFFDNVLNSKRFAVEGTADCQLVIFYRERRQFDEEVAREFHACRNSRAIQGNATFSIAECRRPVYIIFRANDRDVLTVRAVEVSHVICIRLHLFEFQRADIVRRVFNFVRLRYIFYPSRTIPLQFAVFKYKLDCLCFVVESTFNSKYVTYVYSRVNGKIQVTRHLHIAKRSCCAVKGQTCAATCFKRVYVIPVTLCFGKLITAQRIEVQYLCAAIARCANLANVVYFVNNCRGFYVFYPSRTIPLQFAVFKYKLDCLCFVVESTFNSKYVTYVYSRVNGKIQVTRHLHIAKRSCCAVKGQTCAATCFKRVYVIPVTLCFGKLITAQGIEVQYACAAIPRCANLANGIYVVNHAGFPSGTIPFQSAVCEDNFRIQRFAIKRTVEGQNVPLRNCNVAQAKEYVVARLLHFVRKCCAVKHNAVTRTCYEGKRITPVATAGSVAFYRIHVKRRCRTRASCARFRNSTYRRCRASRYIAIRIVSYNHSGRTSTNAHESQQSYR